MDLNHSIVSELYNLKASSKLDDKTPGRGQETKTRPVPTHPTQPKGLQNNTFSRKSSSGVAGGGNTGAVLEGVFYV